MKSIRTIFIFIIFLNALRGFSQKNSRVIIDAKTKQPIDYVYINSNDKRITLFSNKDGRFIPVYDDNIRSFSFYKIGYQKRVIASAALMQLDTVFLSENVITLETIDITVRAIDTLVKDKRFYVTDYLLLPNNDLLLLTSKINVKGFEIAYFKKGKGITCTKKIKEEGGEHFFMDCVNNRHLVTDVFSRQIYFNSDSTFDFLPKYARARFDSTLANCVLKIDTQLIVKYSLPPRLIRNKFLQNSFFLNYLKVSKHKRELFYSVLYNKEMRDMLDNEMSDMDNIVANYKLIGFYVREAPIENAHRLFYTKIATPIYAPIFLKNDTVVVFNFQENLIVFLNKNAEILKQTKLNENSFSVLRDFEVIYDGPKQVFYLKTKHLDRSCLQKINIHTGELGAEIKLEKVFAKNIQIQNGKIYYLVREKGWDDTCYLYQQN